MPTLDDHIAQSLRDSERSGELRSAPSYGKPLAPIDGWDETPAEFRLPFKILKEAGIVPPEVEAMRELAALKRDLESCTDADARHALRQRISDKQQAIALRLEGLRASGRL
jgi:hypothetical protein